MIPDMNKESDLYKTACLLAGESSFGEIADIHAIRGGANNRVYRVENGNRKAFLKVYFTHPSDPRNRLDAEFSFIRFVWDNGVRTIPEPLACDREKGIALYEWIEGRPLMPQEMTEAHVQQALEFFTSLNEFKNKAHHIDSASEACFSLAEHIGVVDKRIERLLCVKGQSEADFAAARFVKAELGPAWDKTRESVIKEMQREGWVVNAILPLSDRRLSPSDFGFHNALLTDGGAMKFIDFEYAGWDDPAKTVCDFFCQPQVPVPLSFFDMSVEAVLATVVEKDRHRRRISALFPVYQFKWCCIVMNDFLTAGSERRRFADNNMDWEKRKMEQLSKAVDMLKNIRITLS